MGRKRKSNCGLPSRVYRHGKGYRYHPKTGKPVPLGASYVEAMARWAELSGQQLPPTPTETLAALMDAYEREALPAKAPRTQTDNRIELRLLRQAFGHMRPDTVEPHHIYAYMDARGAPVRANREKALLSSVFQFAIRKGVKTENPCRLVRRNPERPRDRLVEDAEIAAWRAHAGPLLNAYADLKLLIGQRQGDLLRLSRAADKPDGLHVQVAKTRRRVIFEWTPELRAAVDAIYALERPATSLAFFPLSRGARRGAPLTQRGFKSLWQRAMNAYVATGGARFTEHDLRGKVATDARAQGRDAQRILQHATAKQTDAYIKVRQVEVVRPLSRK